MAASDYRQDPIFTLASSGASTDGKQRRLTLARQWRRAIENGEIERSTPIHYEPGPGSGSLIEAGGCPELAALFDEIKGPLPQPETVAPEPAPPAAESQAERLARIEAEVAAAPAALPDGSRSALRIGRQTEPWPQPTPAAREGAVPAERSGPGWAMQALTRYAVFEGRARRSEYWNFQLFVMLPLVFMFGVAGAMNSEMLVGLLALVWLGLLAPALAVTVRRLHDRGLSGWLIVPAALLSLIPMIGFLIGLGFIALLALPGNDGPNAYGPDPKS